MLTFKNLIFFQSLIFSFAVILPIIDVTHASDLVDLHPSCGEWRDQGECDNNPNYMLENCKKSCNEALGSETELAHIGSVYDLEAEDIDGSVVRFDDFKGKVVVVVNVASNCGYTESHYAGLVRLYSMFRETDQFEILAFPCNQFGAQEPATCSKIKRFAASKGVDFRMMNKINVNGPNTHLVYRYLKSIAGPPSIKWNFNTYYLIDQGGNVKSFTDVEPSSLISQIDSMISDEL
mmetsp:Transcript_3559/g.7360  ORF Transcript_3559/g.7360 Transcript_3559/m.7360 type:complete len:235 (-) Transcript_3559:90-794(-)